jgi:RNA polymerase sigma factor (sigma-70 family)
MTDRELLNRYVADGAHDAFAELVRRHVDVVYTAAVRQTRNDTDAAEEVTQRVFILLAGKAKTLAADEHVILGGWLFNAVRFVAKDVLRKEERRARHEQKAAEMAQQEMRSGDAEPAWKDVEEELDEAMAGLDERSRGLIVLRFFEGKTAREVGERLGISEEAARKRVSRAVDELRQLFARRGVVMSASALAEGLATVALLKAPEGLAASSASAATSAVTAATTATTSTSAAKIAGVLMASAKVKTAAVVAATLLFTTGAVTVGPKFFSPVKSRTVTVAPTGPTITGVVLGIDGKPVANAEVRVATAAESKNPYPGPRDRADGVTDASGKYVLPKPADDKYVLVIRTDTGYAEASWKQLARGEAIKLVPWGRIEGIALAAGKPQPKANIHLWRVGDNDEPVSHQTSVTADANGKFVIPRVAPGFTQLYRTTRPNTFRSTDWQYVEVQSGKTTIVQIGGRGGASVVGRIAVPAEMAKFVVFKDTGPLSSEANVRLELEPIYPKRPKHEKDEAPEEYRAIEEAFGRTPEGRVFKEWQFGRNFELNPDGTFRIDDLPPGKYSAYVRHFEEQPEVSFLEDVAKTEFKFEIPTPTTTQPTPAQPIDIGSAVPESLVRVRPGDVAPDISVTTIDGETWRLADHKGKVFVLVCWGTEERPEQATFGELAAKYGKDPRVAILGCFSANDVEEARPFIKRWKLDFPHTSDIKLMNLYDNSWPSAVIVGRDGKVVQKHLSRETLMQYVQAVVETNKPPPPATKPARRR